MHLGPANKQCMLLSLMYIHTVHHDVQHTFCRATRGADRCKFEVERYNVIKYKNSPYYKGSELWDALARHIIDSTCLTEFKRHLMTVNHEYQDA